MKEFKITDVRIHPGDAGYLIDDGEVAILYDTGFGFTGKEMAEKVKDALGDRRLDYIFLTHSHYDHVLAVPHILRLFPDAKVVAGEYAAAIFKKESAKNLMRKLDHDAAEESGYGEYEDLTDLLSVDITVKEGDVIRAGDHEFRVIALPGHTKCSIAFYLEEKKLLLGCETMGVYNGEDNVLPFYLVSYKMTLDSLEKAKGLDIKNVLVPHVGYLTEEETEFYIKRGSENAVSEAEHIAKMLKEGKDTEEIFEDFKRRFYKGKMVEMYPLQAMILNTHIIIDVIKRELI
ncbi:MAG: MBL fold metallo-hydrolase [Clostridia bacterium]|nr:MBL fold metallo-hydrolase [Clostridia bacterium]